MGTYLQDHPPRIRQYRTRYATPNGVFVVHSAESAPDVVADDTGAEGVARFIQDRTTPGSYHSVFDSDSRLRLVPFELAAYGDGTGSNEFAIHLSFATQAARWPTLPADWVDGALRQGAKAAAEAARWLRAEHGITVPARRITRAQSEAGVPGFISHGERDPGRRTDPGPAFPWDRFLAYYAAEMEEDDMASPETQEQLNRIEANGKQILKEQRAERRARSKTLSGMVERQKRIAAAVRKRSTVEQVEDLATQLDDLAAQTAALVDAIGDAEDQDQDQDQAATS